MNNVTPVSQIPDSEEQPNSNSGMGLEVYSAPLKSLQILLNRTQAGPGRAVKEQQ